MKQTIMTIATLLLGMSCIMAQKNPELIFKIGSGKDRMIWIEFISQGFCRIESREKTNDRFLVKNADFTYHFYDSLGNETIEKENIKCNELLTSGPMKKLKPGDKIDVKNILGINSKTGVTKEVEPRTFTLF